LTVVTFINAHCAILTGVYIWISTVAGFGKYRCQSSVSVKEDLEELTLPSW